MHYTSRLPRPQPRKEDEGNRDAGCPSVVRDRADDEAVVLVVTRRNDRHRQGLVDAGPAGAAVVELELEDAVAVRDGEAGFAAEEVASRRRHRNGNSKMRVEHREFELEVVRFVRFRSDDVELDVLQGSDREARVSFRGSSSCGSIFWVFQEGRHRSKEAYHIGLDRVHRGRLCRIGEPVLEAADLQLTGLLEGPICQVLRKTGVPVSIP